MCKQLSYVGDGHSCLVAKHCVGSLFRGTTFSPGQTAGVLVVGVRGPPADVEIQMESSNKVTGMGRKTKNTTSESKGLCRAMVLFLAYVFRHV